MNEEKLIEELMNSRKLQCSLVAFLGDLLKKFFSGEIDEDTFKKIFEDESCQSKMYLVYMGRDNIATNQKIFRNEFYLADRINHAIYEHHLSGQEFEDALKQYIIDYNEANA